MKSSVKSRQQDYISRLTKLYSSVETWIERTDLKAIRNTVELNEEVPGRYEAPTLKILDAQGKKVAELLPVGAWIIGAEGRVDLVGLLDRNGLVYLREGGPHIQVTESEGPKDSREWTRPLFKGVEQTGWYWIGEPRRGRAHPLPKELFLDLLSEVSDYDVR